MVESCSDALRLDLRSELGDELYGRTEEDLLKAMKNMAVRESNPMVHRNRMRSMKQGEAEQMRNSIARLRESAIDCNFAVNCTAELCGSKISFVEMIPSNLWVEVSRHPGKDLGTGVYTDSPQGCYYQGRV